MFASAPNSGPISLFVFGQIVLTPYSEQLLLEEKKETHRITIHYLPFRPVCLSSVSKVLPNLLIYSTNSPWSARVWCFTVCWEGVSLTSSSEGELRRRRWQRTSVDHSSLLQLWVHRHKPSCKHTDAIHLLVAWDSGSIFWHIRADALHQTRLVR